MRDSGGGSIVLTARKRASSGTSGETVYSAAKAGVIALAKSLAREWARFGIRVNVVAPGVTQTPLLESQGGEALPVEHRARYPDAPCRAAPTRSRRPSSSCLRDAASYVTGQTLCVGGGLTMSS